MEGLLYRYLVRRTSGAEDREVYAWLEASEKNRSLFFEVAAVWSAHRTLISPATGERCDAMPCYGGSTRVSTPTTPCSAPRGSHGGVGCPQRLRQPWS